MNWIRAAVFVLLPCGFAHAQNSSLLHVRTPEVLSPVPRGLPGMSITPRSQGAVSQTQGPPLLPVNPPRLNDGRAASTVMPPEFMPGSSARPNQYSARSLPDIDPAVGLRGVSWTYQPAPPLRQFRIQDIVSIRVDEISRTMAEGDAQTRRNSLFSAVLSDWIKLTRNGIVPDPQTEGDPTVASQSQSNFRAEASIESRESFTFSIAARIVDIRPNGNLVLEAREKFRHNDNLWETTLSGICRAQDIGPDNVVLSGDLIDLEIQKEDRGYIRDGYQRGWFQRFFDHVKPF